MKLAAAIALFIFTKTHFCQDLDKYFDNVNQNVVKFNRIAADIAWTSSVDPGNTELPIRAANYQKKRIKWQQRVCDKLVALSNEQYLNSTQRRQTYLLCRGPKFTFDEARKMSKYYEELQSIYSEAQICIPTKKLIHKTNLTEFENAILNYLSTINKILDPEPYPASDVQDGKQTNHILFAADKALYLENTEDNGYNLCLHKEEEFENLMKNSRNEEVLRWLWLVWRNKIGPPMKEPYKKLVDVENKAARRNGYKDIGASWRDELEIPNVRQLCQQLYDEIKPLYSLLHGVVRFFLRKHYGDEVSERGPIPAHLLGNLWSQNWESLYDLIVQDTLDLDQSIIYLNWTVAHMAKRAEDFYQSLGLPAMPDSFWRKSIFARQNHRTRCHGTAASMFRNGDFRLLYCSETSFEDFYVLHHEFGHIQYYMAYEQQPGLFRQANAALHETIGDTIMYGVVTPQHLNRLGLINDSILYNPSQFETKYKDPEYETYEDENIKVDEEMLFESDLKNNDKYNNDQGVKKFDHDFRLKIPTDDVLMLKLALNKLPQIPFALLIDEYRWNYFEGNLDLPNEEFWAMALKLQGIVPPIARSEEYFDVGAKFHVPDNTPYIRYFLSSFLQHQLFESLCKAAVFGRRGVKEGLPNSILLRRCDIYGSKAGGKLLKDLMSRGDTQNWREILLETIGEGNISAAALKRYYRPLFKLLQQSVKEYRIPIGW